MNIVVRNTVQKYVTPLRTQGAVNYKIVPHLELLRSEYVLWEQVLKYVFVRSFKIRTDGAAPMTAAVAKKAIFKNWGKEQKKVSEICNLSVFFSSDSQFSSPRFCGRSGSRVSQGGVRLLTGGKVASSGLRLSTREQVVLRIHIFLLRYK